MISNPAPILASRSDAIHYVFCEHISCAWSGVFFFLAYIFEKKKKIQMMFGIRNSVRVLHDVFFLRLVLVCGVLYIG